MSWEIKFFFVLIAINVVASLVKSIAKKRKLVKEKQEAEQRAFEENRYADSPKPSQAEAPAKPAEKSAPLDVLEKITKQMSEQLGFDIDIGTEKEGSDTQEIPGEAEKEAPAQVNMPEPEKPRVPETPVQKTALEKRKALIDSVKPLIVPEAAKASKNEPAPAEAPKAHDHQKASGKKHIKLRHFSRNDLREAIVYSTIVGKPKGY